LFWVFLQHRKHPPLASGTQNAVVGKVYPTEKVNTRGDGFEYDFMKKISPIPIRQLAENRAKD